MLSTLTTAQQGSRDKISATQIKDEKMASSGALTEFNGDAYKTMGQTSFGSQTERFRGVNQELKKQVQLPGPGNYYSFGAGNISPRDRVANNHPFNESRMLDDQWNNKSMSNKFAQQATALQGLANPAFKTYRKRA